MDYGLRYTRYTLLGVKGSDIAYECGFKPTEESYSLWSFGDCFRVMMDAIYGRLRSYDEIKLLKEIRLPMKIEMISVGIDYVMCLSCEGTVFAKGWNRHGKFGIDNPSDEDGKFHPEWRHSLIDASTRIKFISTNDSCSFFVTETNQVLIAGFCEHHHIGLPRHNTRRPGLFLENVQKIWSHKEIWCLTSSGDFCSTCSDIGCMGIQPIRLLTHARRVRDVLVRTRLRNFDDFNVFVLKYSGTIRMYYGQHTYFIGKYEDISELNALVGGYLFVNNGEKLCWIDIDLKTAYEGYIFSWMRPPLMDLGKSSGAFYGSDHMLWLGDDNHIWGLGRNDYYQLGLGYASDGGNIRTSKPKLNPIQLWNNRCSTKSARKI